MTAARDARRRRGNPSSGHVDTPHGPARVTVHPAADAAAVLLLGHGAGGGFGAPDLRDGHPAALAAGVHVAQVEQPYRVAGRRAPAPAAQLDAAWLAVVDRRPRPRCPGCRCSSAAAARAPAWRAAPRRRSGPSRVLCLAFPVHPPGRPEKDRLAELAAPTVPVLVVQGERDPFGRPPPAPGREVVLLAGDHSLKADLPGVAAAVTAWLPTVLPR